jgi:hypothetical protein
MKSSDPQDQSESAPVSGRVELPGTLFGYSKSATDRPDDEGDEIDAVAPE